MNAPRRERKKRAVRERLLAEAQRLFQIRGVAAVSAAEIAEAADVAAGTFFNHFPTKDALVAELAGRVLAPLLRPLEPGPAAASVGPRVAAFFAEAAGTLARARAESGDLLATLLRASGGGEAALDPEGRLRRAWSQLLFEGQRRGEIRCEGEAAFLAELVVGAFSASLLHWLHDPRYPLAQRMAQLESFVSGALGTPRVPPANLPQPNQERAA